MCPETNLSLKAPEKKGARWFGNAVCAIGRGLRTALGWLPITLRGLTAVPILVAVLYYYGVLRQDQIVLSMAACGLFLTGAAVVVLFQSALWIRIRLGLCRPSEMLRIEAGTATRTGFSLGRAHWNPLLKIDVAWELPEDVEVRTVSVWGRLEEEVTATARAFSGQVVRRVRVSDVLGLARVTFRLRQSQSVRILPARGQVGELERIGQLSPGEGVGHPQGRPGDDLIETRKYGAGDPLKLVLWKVYGRTGRLMVRTPERSVAESDKVLGYFVAGPSDDRSAEIARSVLESGWFGAHLFFGADGAETVARKVTDAVESVARSASARAEAGQRLSSFLGRGAETGVQACVLFVPARTGAWLRRVVETLRSFPGPFQVVVGVDERNLAAPTSRLRRWLCAGSQGHGDVAEVRKIVEAFDAVGALA